MELSVGFGEARGSATGHVQRRSGGNGKPARKQSTRSSRGSGIGQRAGRIASWLIYSAMLAALLYYGWLLRGERHLTPEYGLGYWLGIAGATAMLLLLIYPLRKRYRFLQFLGSVPFWFRFHMALGLFGPTLILLHCNFKSESLNATVALYSMLVVACSGLVGRLLYGHVHSTLSGTRLAATSFFESTEVASGTEGPNHGFRLSPRSMMRMTELTQAALAPKRGLLSAIGHAWLIRWQSRQLSRSIGRETAALSSRLAKSGAAPRRQLKQARRNFEHITETHLKAVRHGAELAIYERLFALWHFLHLPLFLMLVIAAIVHVIAVHLY